MITTARIRLERVEAACAKWASSHGVAVLRIVLGIIFVWFGVLKFCPGLCDVEDLAGRTMQVLTLGLIPVKICIRLLAIVECGIGAGLVTGRCMRLTTLCLMMHLAGTFLPLAMFPDDAWKHFPYAPTLVGQYILKNLILMAAAAVVGAEAFARAKVPRLAPMRPRMSAAAETWASSIGVS